MKCNTKVLYIFILISGFYLYGQNSSIPTIAVLNLENQDLSRGEAAVMTEILRDELLKTQAYKIVEKQRLNEVMAEIGFQQMGFTSEGVLRLGKILNVDKIFLGTLGEIQKVRFLTVRIVDVETGQVIASATEKGFTVQHAELAVTRVVYKLQGLPPPGGISPPWLEEISSERTKYLMGFTGWNVGNILDFHAKSAFKNGPAGPGIPIWEGTAPEIESKASFPNFGLRLGAQRKSLGADFEISLLSHRTPAQMVFADIKGHQYIPEIDSYYAVSVDELDFPDNFLRVYSLGFGGNFYFHSSFGTVRPYAGFGVSLLMNMAKSDYPGPGNFGIGIEGENLNSTSLGWEFHIPIGLQVNISSTKFLYFEFRMAQNLFDYISGDVFQEEEDKFILQTFQALIGFGRIFK